MKTNSDKIVRDSMDMARKSLYSGANLNNLSAWDLNKKQAFNAIVQYRTENTNFKTEKEKILAIHNLRWLANLANGIADELEKEDL